MAPDDRLVVGIDAGGSRTRALLAGPHGERLAVGTAPGSNPVSRGTNATVEHLIAALRAALAGTDAGRVQRAVLGLAGSNAADQELSDALERVARSVGLRCPLTLASDLEVAFAAGTTAEHGVVLVAGTGAVAGEVRAARLVRRVDGYGWLLGDEGSAFWLGREGVRACLAALDGRGAPTSLVEPVVRALGGDPPGSRVDARARAIAQVVERAYRQPPVALAELAPLVTAAAEAGDRVALEITRRGAGLLLAAVDALRLQAGDGEGVEAVVLAGGVLLSPNPLASAVRAGLRDRFGLAPLTAADGAAGAACLALRALTGRPVPPSMHRRLTGA